MKNFMCSQVMVVKVSPTKNGPSAANVVIKPIIVRRYTLFCKIVGTYICRTA